MPSREFGDQLREHLRALEARAQRPPQLWAMVAGYGLFGVLLLVIAAILGL